MSSIASRILNGRSNVPGAMVWMFGLWLVLSIMLGAIPVVGPFVGPIVGGYVGGRRAATPGRAFMAAILPAFVMAAAILALGAVAGALAAAPLVGALAAILAGATWIIVFVNDLLLIIAALIGGYVASNRPASP